MRILFIDDDPSSIITAMKHCEEGLAISGIPDCRFEDAESTLSAYRPDIVVLDLLQGPPSDGNIAGGTVYGLIWDQQFCPVVVYSAEPDWLDNEDHPFVKKVQKGSGSEEAVLEAILSLRPHVEALQRTESEVRQRLSEALREVAPLAFRDFVDEDKRKEVIVRSGRRRVAAMMDEPPTGETALASWECYLYPPVSPYTLLGDVLQIDDSSNVPESYRIVLTPSCDMVRTEGRLPRVQEVLVAKCYSMEKALASVGMAGNKDAGRIRERLLSSGYSQSVIPFPKLEGVIPTMAANLRDLELIPIGNIGNDATFHRVASLDSPFRELVAWAYLQNAGRPGLPDRDLESWAKEIVGTL